ncbi:unnamed protein product [Trichobilharzia szidati]|nr:unnamed protein product [Trichobilharzia szidati]
MTEELKTIMNGVMSARWCIIKFIICLCIMTATTMIITLLVANISQLETAFYQFWPIPVAFMFVASILQLVFLLALNLENAFPVNYMLAALSVFTSSSGLAVETARLNLLTLLSWSLTALLSVLAVIVGYKMRRLNLKGYHVMYYVISGLMIFGGIPFMVLYLLSHEQPANLVFVVPLVLCLTVALYLTGQVFAKLPDKEQGVPV